MDSITAYFLAAEPYIPAALMLIWLIWGIWAPVREGKSARHTYAWIEMPPAAKNGNIWYAVLVQERGEFRFSKLLALIAGSPFLFIDFPAPFPVGFLLQFSIMIFVDGFSRQPQPYDLAGHNAEWMAAERTFTTTEDYRAGEVTRLTMDFDKIDYFNLRGRPQEEKETIVSMGLMKWEWLGHIFYLLGSTGSTDREKAHP